MNKRNILLILPACISLASCKNDTGFIKVEKLSILASDINNAYSPSVGNTNVLVVPISFPEVDAKLGTWTKDKLDKVNEAYFLGEDSLKSYYDVASFGKMNLSGLVTDIIEINEMTYQEINENEGSYEKLFDMIEIVSIKVQEKYKDIDWAEYDKNNDGCFDNIHMITNYKATVWAENLWPHMFSTNRPLPEKGLGVNVYSVSSILNINDATTAIHEQGHIFGLEDYYDYSGKVHYLGGADMQDGDAFDWNSYSKMVTGWVSPYVYKGTTNNAKITLKAASINGDCLIIPANYSSWNGSAYDEYFLLELFSPFGNNKRDWKGWPKYLGKYGVRIYHVDSRLWGANENENINHQFLSIDDLDTQAINSIEDRAKFKYATIGANNSYYWTDYEGGIEQSKDFNLLGLIQAQGKNTFGDPKSIGIYDTYLGEKDLFHEGDTFTFEKYANFIDKTLTNKKTMNNGEIFPYSIYFDEMSNESVTLTISRIDNKNS